MAKIREIMERVDELRPNAFSEKLKLGWISELEGKVAADVMLMSIDEIQQIEYVYPESMEAEPLVSYPHQEIYVYWLQAQIDYANGEYNKYQNSMEMYNQIYGNYVRWFANTYEPALGYPDRPCRYGWEDPPYYLTAYGLARKGGFQGSVDEWLESLKGPQGEPGKTAYDYAVAGGFEGTEEEFREEMAKAASDIENAEELAAHIVSMNNPHKVTAEQIGAAPAGNYATETFVTNKIAEAQLGGGNANVDLSGYATKDDLGKLTAADVGALPTTGGDITGDLCIRKNIASIAFDTENGSALILKNAAGANDFGTSVEDVRKDGSKASIHVHADRGSERAFEFFSSKDNAFYTALHMGNKHLITPEDIGAQPSLDFMPIQQGGGARQNSNKVFLGWTTQNTLGVQVDGTDLGDVALIPAGRTLVDFIYPVNSIYISYSHTSPASLFGGTWTRMENTFLWGCLDGNDIGARGGTYFETLTTAQLPNLHGSMQFRALSEGSNVASVKDPGNVFTITADGGDNWGNSCGKSQESNACDLITFNVGEGAAHNNMPPYTQVSIWRRVA